MSKVTPKKPSQLRDDVQPAYGNICDIGAYLGARSHSAAQRRVAWLRANGLKHFLISGIRHFRYSDVDDLLSRLQGEGFCD